MTSNSSPSRGTRVNWLLDGEMFADYHDELVTAIRGCNGTAISVRRPRPPYDWDDVGDSFRNSFPPNSCVVTHGDLDLVSRVIAHGDWSPGAFATFENFACESYYPHFGRRLLNHDHVTLPFGEFLQQAGSLFDRFGRDDRLFVRPNSPLKSFTGQTIDRASLVKDLEFIAFQGIRADAKVVVSSAKDILAEWRFVVTERSVVAGSQYKLNREAAVASRCDVAAIQFAKDTISVDYSPDPVWILDICQTTDGDFHILEIGGFSHSNLYACDKRLVAGAVSQIALSIHGARC